MFIVVPHQRPAHYGHECSNGGRDCEADCNGCREMRDSHAVIGDWDTPPDMLRQMARAYRGHQQHVVHALAERLV